MYFTDLTLEDQAIYIKLGLANDMRYLLAIEDDELLSRLLVNPYTLRPQIEHVRKAVLRIWHAHRGAGTSEGRFEVY